MPDWIGAPIFTTRAPRTAKAFEELRSHQSYAIYWIAGALRTSQKPERVRKVKSLRTIRSERAWRQIE
jgi:hypothetical protein